MKKIIVAVAVAGAASLSLGACATTDPTTSNVATGAGVGAAGGAALGAAVGGLGVIEGAVLGAAVGGLAGAVWADNDRDGRVDGYYQNGQYTAGAPAGYDPARRCVNVAGSAATGAGIGAAGGAGVGAVVGGINPLEGAVVGAIVGGLAGAVYADQNNDGCVDGYTRGGQYYPGAPQPGAYQQQPQYQAPVRSGERG